MVQLHLVASLWKLSPANEGNVTCSVKHFLGGVSAYKQQFSSVATGNTTCLYVTPANPVVHASRMTVLTSATELTVKGSGFAADKNANQVNFTLLQGSSGHSPTFKHTHCNCIKEARRLRKMPAKRVVYK